MENSAEDRRISVTAAQATERWEWVSCTYVHVGGATIFEYMHATSYIKLNLLGWMATMRSTLTLDRSLPP